MVDFAGSTLDELRTLTPRPGAEQTVATIHALIAEIDRLNKWADSFSDAQLKERALAEERIKLAEGEAANWRRRYNEIGWGRPGFEPIP